MHVRWSLIALLLSGCAEDVGNPQKPGPFIVAAFDPTASPTPQIPLPNDLLKTGGDGTHLNVPDLPGESPAQVDFNHYLNTLDGFPSSTPGSFAFSGPVDPASVTVGSPTMNGSVVIFDVTAMMPFTDFTLMVSADGTMVTITPTKRWASGHTFFVMVFGGSDPAGVKGAPPQNELVLSSPAFFFLRSPVPLVGLCTNGETPGCVCPPEVVAKGDPNDKTCHSVITGLPDAQARQLEAPRQQLNAALTAALPASGSDNGMPRSRSNVVLAWSFTITDMPMAVFDPTRSDVPFPNDVLINQMTGLVNLPIDPSDPQAAIKMGLNTLDGFSTTAPETLNIDAAADINPATVVPNKSALLLGLTGSNINPPFTAAPVLVNNNTQQIGTIAIQPTSALEPDQNRYAVIVTSGVTDTNGRPLVAPPTIVLTRGTNPLVDAQGHSTVPQELNDMQAQQLEMLRLALAPLYNLAEMSLMIPRNDIAALWTFTTQSISRPLNALDELPTKSAFSTNVTITHVANKAEITAKAAMLTFPTSHLDAIVFGTFTTTRAAGPNGVIAFSRNAIDSTARFAVQLPAAPVTETIRFVLTLPAAPGSPVAILQHGLGLYRGDLITVSDAFAAAGWGTILIDLPFHGVRSACTQNSDCAGGGTCDTTTGACSAGLAFAAPSSMDPLACSLEPLTGDPADCRPVASGAAFVNVGNLFASRDNFRQYVVDAAQLMRVLSDGANTMGLQQQLGSASLSYNPAQLGFIGESLGGFAGSLFLAVAPQPPVGVLNVTGGHLLQVIEGGDLASFLTPLLTSLNVQPDTAAFFQLANTATWILDPADPFAVGQFLVRAPVTNYVTNRPNAPKAIIVQEAGMDPTVPPPLEAALSAEILGPAGIDQNGHAQGLTTGGMKVSTFFPTAVHVSLFLPLPSAAVTQAVQTQAVGFISSSGAALPSP
jgi:hypothetical protein